MTTNLFNASLPIYWIGSLIFFIAFVSEGRGESVESDFRVHPYLQNPTSSEITIRWFSNSPRPGKLTVTGSKGTFESISEPISCPILRDNPFAPERSSPPAPPWLHSIRLKGLSGKEAFRYRVEQSESSFESTFQLPSREEDLIRFIVFSDSETEPESSSTPPVDWPVHLRSNRPEGFQRYFVDQTTGFRENLKVITSRNPHFICIPGDLVESGGEQRDWEEFWRHLSGDLLSIGSRIPIFPAIGNHETFGGPGGFGGYSAEAANFAVSKYLTYFEFPSNGAPQAEHRGRYYRIDWGPISILTLDTSDGSPHQSESDTNHNLQQSNSPDFNPGTPQYLWLEANLKQTQIENRFTFVQYHHVPYGSGPHSVPMSREGFSGQSGIATRVLLPLMIKYGVDALFCGHDEMLERSSLEGFEELPDGTTRRRTIHVFDVGIGGDGLRGPVSNFDNPHRRFLAHDDLPEVWEGPRLVSGGKHYGHLEVNVIPPKNGDGWKASIEPVHIFPRMDREGKIIGWERRVLPDALLLTE